MNDGIITQGSSSIQMPYRLLGSPSVISTPIFFRQEWHPEVIDWSRRSSNNGGRFSYSTLIALNNFCNSIDASGLRSRLLRLNLMCGENLLSSLVPLYLSGSLTNTVLGNATDTNFNFVNSDYSESAGLLGNGSTKYLDTGFSLNSAGVVSTGHLSIYRAAWSGSAGNNLMGCLNSGFTQIHQIGINSSANAYENYYGGSTLTSNTVLSSAAAHLIITRTSSTGLSFYTNGSSNGFSSSSTSPSDPVRTIFIFGRNQGAAAGLVSARVRSYSIGGPLTAAQASTFYSICATFATALGRTPA